MSVEITVTVVYRCDGPNCRASSPTHGVTFENLFEVVKTGDLQVLEPDNLPVGWTHVLSNLSGVTGTERRNFCSVRCLRASTMQNNGTGLGRYES